MNKHKLAFCACAWLALAAAGAIVPGARAQDSGEPRVENRVLLIFDTSYAMKKRVPAEERGLQKLFALTFSSQLQPGDSVGVWTFNQEVQTGVCPLQRWSPDNLIAISSNVIKVVEKHRYNRDTSFEKLVPELERVMSGCSRLTTLVFCDGEAPIHGTPYDDEINSIFTKHESLMRKDREPYVLVFRTEYSKFVGSTINTADNINVPQFPLPPHPPVPPPVVEEQPAPAPTAPPLIIIGTKVGTNEPPPAPPPMIAPVVTAPPPPAPVPAPPVNAAPASPTSMIIIMPPGMKTNAVPPTNALPPESRARAGAPQTNEMNTTAEMEAPAAPTNVVASAPPVAPTPNPPAPMVTATAQEPGVTKGELAGIAGGVLFFAGVGCYFIARQSRRRNRSSLITESLKKR